jgi:hypothetical protein
VPCIEWSKKIVQARSVSPAAFVGKRDVARWLTAMVQNNGSLFLRSREAGMGGRGGLAAAHPGVVDDEEEAAEELLETNKKEVAGL